MNYLQKVTYFCTKIALHSGVCVQNIVTFCTMVILCYYVFLNNRREYYLWKGEFTCLQQLWIDEKIYKSNLSSYGLAAYCAIKSLLFNDERKEICTTYEILAYQITKNIKCSRRFYENFKNGYEELFEVGIIKKIDSRNKYDVIDCNNLFLLNENDYFTIITYEELLKIFQIKDVNNFLLLKYFIFLIGTISSTIEVYLPSGKHKTRVLGTLTIEYISKLSGISERSIIEYNKILESNGLIYIYRHNDFILQKDTGELSRLINIYGRLEDKEYIDTFAANQKSYKSSYKYIENNIKKANQKRRLAQMYNQISKGNDSKYSIEDIKEIYLYILHENKKYENTYKKTGDVTCLEKIRNIKVFQKYDYLKEENTNENGYL